MTPGHASSPAPRRRGTVDDLVLTAAGVLARDGRGRCLLVELAYDLHHPFAVPGGGSEPHETPRATAAREVLEELGLEAELGEVACVDYVLGADRPPVIAYLYRTARPLTDQDLARIRMQESEIRGWSLHTPQQCTQLLPPRLGRRVAAALAAADRGSSGPALVAGRPHDPHATAKLLIAAERTTTTPRSVPPPGVVLPMDRPAYLASRPRAHCRAEVLITRPDGRLWVATGPQGPRLPGGPVPVRQELPQQTATRLTRLRGPLTLRAIDWVTTTPRPTVVHLYSLRTASSPTGPGMWIRPADIPSTLPPTDAQRIQSILPRTEFTELVDAIPATHSTTPEAPHGDH
jgi:ADP-ribose pyrophosphatase YjhB (NUDIX family)